jgi:hypothetical protein
LLQIPTYDIPYLSAKNLGVVRALDGRLINLADSCGVKAEPPVATIVEAAL